MKLIRGMERALTCSGLRSVTIFHYPSRARKPHTVRSTEFNARVLVLLTRLTGRREGEKVEGGYGLPVLNFHHSVVIPLCKTAFNKVLLLGDRKSWRYRSPCRHGNNRQFPGLLSVQCVPLFNFIRKGVIINVKINVPNILTLRSRVERS